MRNRDFITGKVPITKEEVRAISINKLDLLNAKTFIDVGAGTGSISIEAGYHYPDLRVIAIERNDDALDLVNKNIENFNLTNVEVVKASFTNLSRMFTPSDMLNDKNTGICLAASCIFSISSSLYPVVARTTGVLVFKQYSNIPSKASGLEKSITTSESSFTSAKLE